ncbi:Lon protease [Photobacterium aquimaris]|uniref:Lon protease n=1 Tax=Photobacterium aquimaris TaxID=512643 RepID=A0A2T3IRX3_9GAMM|nr:MULTISPECIES: LON peptidase substrate-binding domain-containing protein [Photobacterium]OBU15141.1 Lon protease [Photobacterium aquimaris]OBU23385.1 Lon protease [Photobacterium aquimaris]PSU31085.1 Lon protease [Photobacterium aquimaris]PSW01854.1 Lon protease [Photobacterium aquimaris]
MTTFNMPLLFQKRHILPTGRMQLYLSGITHTTTLRALLLSKAGIGICMFSNKSSRKKLYHIGTRVTIEDFNHEPNNPVISLNIYGQELFKIATIEQGSDNIIWGKCQQLPRWPQQEITTEQQLLSTRLQLMFDKYPDLDKLHHQQEFDNLSWLCQRWLEILPLPTQEKQTLLNHPNCLHACDYLMSKIYTQH